MALLDVQRRNQEIGRIRAGVSEGTGKTSRKTGKEIRKPVKLDTFLLSSQNRRVIEAAAELYGGQVEAWEQQWRVITTVSELPCSVPGGEAALNQAWEMWSGGVCVRRCDGVTEQLRQQPCMCPPDLMVRGELGKTGGACKPKSRINLILPDLPGLGVWRLETGSWNAALEIGGVIELLAQAREKGVIVPAMLRLDRRESKRLIDIGVRPDPSRGIKGEAVQARKFLVPVLDVLPTMREMAELGSRPLAAALPPPPVMRALTAGPSAPADPRGEAVQAPAAWTESEAAPSRDAQGIADAARAMKNLAAWRGLWNEASRLGVLDDYVVTVPGQDDAPMDALRVHLEEQGARIKDRR